MAELSRSALDRLGNRLRDSDEIGDEDRELYHEYRANFTDALAEVQGKCRMAIHERIGEGARLKTLESTVAKVRRGTFRLSQISDIAGVRFVVPNLLEQDRAARTLLTMLGDPKLIDYRRNPQNGYRAMHLIALAGKRQAVEVQLRTSYQDLWANTCEYLAEEIDPRLKYGAGPFEAVEILNGLSITLYELDAKLGAAALEESGDAQWARGVEFSEHDSPASLQEILTDLTREGYGGDPHSRSSDALISSQSILFDRLGRLIEKGRGS